MNDVDRIRGLKKAVAARLHAIPGVHAVGVGPKVVGGKKTDELAITVFVVRKKKPEQLAKEELVPTEIEGIKTDVVQLAGARLANADPQSITATVATRTELATQPCHHSPGMEGTIVRYDSPHNQAGVASTQAVTASQR